MNEQKEKVNTELTKKGKQVDTILVGVFVLVNYNLPQPISRRPYNHTILLYGF